MYTWISIRVNDLVHGPMYQFLSDINGYPCTRDGKIRGAKWVSRDFTETLADNELDAAIPPVVSKPQWHELEKLRACMVEAPLTDGIQLSKLAEPYVQKGTWQEGLHGTGGRLGAAGWGLRVSEHTRSTGGPQGLQEPGPVPSSGLVCKRLLHGPGALSPCSGHSSSSWGRLRGF